MASFEQLMQDFVNLDYDKLVGIAQQALVDVMPVCKKVDADNNGVLMATAIILSAVAADGTLTVLEKKFFGDVLGLDADKVDTLISLHTGQEADLVDAFVDNLGSDVKASTLALVTAFAACDEKISREETALITKLLA